MDKKVISINEVRQYLPHRYPFLLVDRVVDYEPGKWIRAIKNVTINEPFFNGHFPQRPIMPGVLILEAMAQASGILFYITVDDDPMADKIFYFAAIDNVRFRRVVEPGDQLTLEVEVIKARRDVVKVKGQALVGDEVACTAEWLCVRKGSTDD
jgi:3-hydroxyacyl-[acyl-carrier-protein] dehydratase